MAAAAHLRATSELLRQPRAMIELGRALREHTRLICRESRDTLTLRTLAAGAGRWH